MMITNSLVQFDRNRHGGLYDRGSADAYYYRQPAPHWYPEGTRVGARIEDLSAEEQAEYMAGYNETDDRKAW